MYKNRKLFIFAMLALSISMIIYGSSLGQNEEVEYHSSLLCLTCI